MKHELEAFMRAGYIANTEVGGRPAVALVLTTPHERGQAREALIAFKSELVNGMIEIRPREAGSLEPASEPVPDWLQEARDIVIINSNAISGRLKSHSESLSDGALDFYPIEERREQDRAFVRLCKLIEDAGG